MVVNLGSPLQKISGFGAASAWSANFRNASDPDVLWSTTTGAGLSLHRLRIPPDGSIEGLPIAKAAVARGVTVWASPWAANSSGQQWASVLAGYVTSMKNSGVPIYAISAGNEPDSNANGAVYYSASGMASWVGSNFGPGLATSGVQLMAPETENWCNFPSYLSALESNTAAWGSVNIVATHEYGCNPSAHADIATAGKEFWETEIYDLQTGRDDGIASGLRVAALIHNALTVANMNAWHYWWLYDANNGGLYDTTNNVWAKRLWVMGNYARFVRPGFQRVSTSGSVPSGVMLTAYRSPADGTVVVVAINNNTSASTLSLFLSGAAPCTMTPWVTSSTDSLASQPGIAVSNSHFSVSLEAQSITSFVGSP